MGSDSYFLRMIEFLKILFLAKVIVLTPEPITINEQIVIELKSPIKAITSGANIEIDVSHLSKEAGIKEVGIIESRKLLGDLLPEGSVKAKLLSENKTVILNHMNFALSNNEAKLILSSNSGVPVDTEFNGVEIVTGIPLNKVKVVWKNHKK